ncbi:MAG: TolC family protein [Sulfurimonas sp.]|nr:TolC family protein [Sulfurimonas sp.]
MKRQILFFIFLFSNVLNAQNLTLGGCIQKALSSHPDIKKETLGVKSSQSGVDVATADYLPQVTINAEYDITRTYALPVNGTFNTKDSDGWAVGATLNQKIWDFSKTTTNIQAQEINEEIAELSLVDAKALLAYKVKLQYEMMLVQKVAIDVREKDLHAKEELYKQAKAFVDNGMKTNADASRFLSSVYLAKDNLAIAKASYEKARMILSLYINEDIEEDAVLENSLETNTTLFVDTQNILQNSPSLKATQKNIQKSGLLYKSTRATHYGSLNAIASYTKLNTLNQYDSSLVGVTYTLPLYSGGRTSALVEQSYLNRQSAEAAFSSASLALKEEFETLLIDIKRLNKTIEAKESQLKASKETQRLLEARYKEGLATYIEILDAVSLTLDANLGLIGAIYEKSSAIHKLEYLQGKSI